MNAHDRLHAAQAAAREGRHAAALREYVWFHDNALKEEPALYGVRLSFALAYWMDLAESYPEARRKLEEIRDRKTATLAAGKGDHALFHDVTSINRSLDEETETYRLFKKLLVSAPLNATAWGDLAREAIVKAGDFKLAAKYSDHPEDALLRYSASLNADVARPVADPTQRRRRLDAFAHIYADRVGMRIAILKGLGKIEDAEACRDWAIALVDSKPVRNSVRDLLTKTEQ